MKKKGIVALGALLILIFFSGIHTSGENSMPLQATIESLKGQVEAKRLTAGEWEPAQKGPAPGKTVP